MVGWRWEASSIKGPPCRATWAGGCPLGGILGISLLGTEHSLLLSQPFTQQEIIGFVIGSISSVLYLFSRLPQIHTNVSLERGGAEWKRRAGLAARASRFTSSTEQKVWVYTHRWLGQLNPILQALVCASGKWA